MTHTVVDASGKAHTVEPGTWWWAVVDPKYDAATIEAVQVGSRDDGVWSVGCEYSTEYDRVVLLGLVVPYVSADAPAKPTPRARTYLEIAHTPVVGDEFRGGTRRCVVVDVDDAAVTVDTYELDAPTIDYRPERHPLSRDSWARWVLCFGSYRGA